MRRIRYSVAMSLDGYIAGPNGEADWIVMDPELGAGFEDYYKQFDALLIGRKTFTAIARPGQRVKRGQFAGFDVLVCSRTIDPRDYPDCTIVAGDLRKTIGDLKQRAGKDIWLFGGGELFRSLLDLGLVDTVEVGVIPVLLGGGIPLLPAPAGRAPLTLVNHKVYPKTGTLGLEYAVKKDVKAMKKGTKAMKKS